MSKISSTLHSRGKLLAKANVQVEFQVICAKCHQPVIITTIIHFADCPQVSVEPCLCSSLTKPHEAVKIVQDMMQDMVVDTKHLVRRNESFYKMDTSPIYDKIPLVPTPKNKEEAFKLIDEIKQDINGIKT